MIENENFEFHITKKAILAKTPLPLAARTAEGFNLCHLNISNSNSS